jgi:hypothetical protein
MKSTEATPCGHFFKQKLTPEKKTRVDTISMAAMAMVLP